MLSPMGAERIPQSTTIRVQFYLTLTSDHVSPATSKTVAITISKNGAAFGNPSAGATNATEIASGWYYVDLSTTDTGTLGPLAVRGTATSSDDAGANFRVVDNVMAGFSGAIAELSQATPAVTPSLAAAIMWMYMESTKAVTVTGSSKTIANDAGTVIAKQALSDDGVTYTQAKAVSGP
jgi:hypothetical protein